MRDESLGTDFGPPWRVVTNLLIFLRVRNIIFFDG